MIGTQKFSSRVLLTSFFMLALVGCSKSGGLNSPEIAYEELDNPGPFVVSGSAFSAANPTFIYADSNGDITTSSNQISVTDPDTATPLVQLASNAVFSDQMDSGTCALGAMTSTATDSSDSTIVTSISAQSCSDQSTLEIDFDTSQLGDNAGNTGDVISSQTYTVDVAPISTIAATGYTTTSGTSGTSAGFTGSGGGIYTVASDNSVVMTFSKDMTGGNLTPTLTGCSVTIASAALVNAGTTVVWTLGNLGSVTTGTTVCTISIQGLTDVAGNPVDPSDPNLTSMTLAFQ